MTERRPPRVPNDWYPLRWPIEMPAQVQEHRSCMFDITVVDISRTGCRLWAGFRMTPGRAAKLHAGSFAPFGATVVWTENWYAALRFDQQIHGSVLRHLTETYPVRTTAHGAPGESVPLAQPDASGRSAAVSAPGRDEHRALGAIYPTQFSQRSV